MGIPAIALASPMTCERVREFLDEHHLSTVVIEHPELLTEEEYGELHAIICY